MALTYKVLGQSQLSTTGAAVYTVPSATQAVVSTLSISNVSNSMATVDLSVDGTVSRAAIWTARNSRVAEIDDIQAATYGSQGYLVGGDDGELRSSTDGVNWTTVTSIGGTTTIEGLAYGNGVYVAINSGSAGYIRYSTDLITWAVADNDRTDAVYFNGTSFIASQTNTSGSNIGIIKTSTNGINWTGTTTITGRVASFTYGDGKYVSCAGSLGPIHYSTDAITWTSVGAGGTLNALTYGNGLFVVGGSSGLIKTSTDAITWTTQTSNFGASAINALIYANGVFVAGGSTGQIRTSTDAVTWTTQSSTITSTINALTYGNGLFVAGANAGVLVTSGPGMPLLYNAQVAPNSENSLTIGITLGSGDSIWAKSNTASAVNVNIFGSEIS